MTSLAKSEIEAAAARRVVFAHQSVGHNILDGVSTLAKEHGVGINIVEGRSDGDEKPGIYHFYVGANGDPLGKIDDFSKTMAGAPFGKADVALVKLCYVDFDSGSDATAIARSYAETLRKLQEQHPATRFVAITSPLTTRPAGVKTWVKELLGRKGTDRADNAKRKQFNDYLRAAFDGAHLFDLAKIEAEPATAEDGTPIEMLRGDLTSDGGHLNDKGQRLAAAALLKLLASE